MFSESNNNYINRALHGRLILVLPMIFMVIFFFFVLTIYILFFSVFCEESPVPVPVPVNESTVNVENLLVQELNFTKSSNPIEHAIWSDILIHYFEKKLLFVGYPQNYWKGSVKLELNKEFILSGIFYHADNFKGANNLMWVSDFVDTEYTELWMARKKNDFLIFSSGDTFFDYCYNFILWLWSNLWYYLFNNVTNKPFLVDVTYFSQCPEIWNCWGEGVAYTPHLRNIHLYKINMDGPYKALDLGHTFRWATIKYCWIDDMNYSILDYVPNFGPVRIYKIYLQGPGYKAIAFFIKNV